MNPCPHFTRRWSAAVSLGLSAAIFLSCGNDSTMGPSQSGQSGSEFFEPERPNLPSEPGPAAPNEATYLDCPCVRLAGSVPMKGTVTSWRASLLDLEVSEVLIEEPPEGSPMAGQHVLGVYVGGLPCYVGDYLPEPGDRVVAYLVNEDWHPNLCCNGCEEQCSTPGGGLSDECLVECQVPAARACAEERKDLPIAGRLLLAPLRDEQALLGASAEDEFSVPLSELPQIFEGGEACKAALGSTMDALPEGTLDDSYRWQASCSE